MTPDFSVRLGTRFAAILIAGLAALFACGEGEQPPTEPGGSTRKISTVEVSPDSAVLDSVGATADFEATARDQKGNSVPGVTFTWSSSDTTVATVDADGTATAQGQGKTAISASAEGVEGDASVRVPENGSSDRPEFIRRSFKAFAGEHHPPDHDIAAGPSRLVAVSNESTVLLSKKGRTLDEGNGNELFAPLLREGEGTFDPRVGYDPETGRFFLVYTAVDGSTRPCEPGGCVNHIYLAVSKSSTPTSLPPDGWHLYGFDGTVDGDSATANTADFPRLGIGAKAIYLVMIMVPSDPDEREGNVYTKIRILNKQKLAVGDSVGWTDFGRMEDPVTGTVGQLQMQPVVRRRGGGMYFVNLPHQSSSCDLGVWELRSPLTSPTLQSTVAESRGVPGPNVSCRHPTDAAQPNNAPRLATRRPVALPTEAVYRDGSLWVAHHVRVEDPDGDRAGIRWAELRVSDGPAARFRQDTVLKVDGAWTFFPAVMADEQGNMGMVYGRSSANQFPSLYFTYRRAGDPLNQVRDPVLLREGEASLTTTGENYIPGSGIRYADFFGMSRDPSDRSWWMLGEYVEGPDRWGGWVANVAF